jgi:hypothetical protein
MQMLEWIYARRTFLEEKRHELVRDVSVPPAEPLERDIDYTREDPSFADADDLEYYHRLCGHIEECTYMIAAILTPPATGLREEVIDWST